jgi:hypothetical protein
MENPEVKAIFEEMLKAIKKLEQTGEKCGCGKLWKLYQSPFFVEQKLVYDKKANCMRDLFVISCPNCKQEFTFESDPLTRLQGLAEETKRKVDKNSKDDRFIVRSIAKFGPKPKKRKG